MDADLIYEIGALKRVKRSGWETIGIKDGESVAEHSYRSAVIAYLLGKEEGFNDKELMDIMLGTLLHDLEEVRTGDLHLVAKRYVSVKEKKLQDDVYSKIKEVKRIYKNKKLMQIIKDADYLEVIFQAREYEDLGNPYVHSWIENAEKKLKTKTAKKMLKKALGTDSFGWLMKVRKK